MKPVKWTAYVRSLQELRAALQAGVQEVILSHRELSRWGALSSAQLSELNTQALAWGMRTLIEWDLLMTQPALERALQVLQDTPMADVLKTASAIRVQDPGALQSVLTASKDTGLGILPIHWVTENGNHNWEALARWRQAIGPRLERLVLSIQIPKATLSDFIQRLDVEVEVLGMGPILLLYTPRHLLSGEAVNDARHEWAAVASSTEHAHSDFRVIENLHGTFLFHGKDYCILEYLSDLRQMGLSALRVDLRFFEDVNQYTEILAGICKLENEEQAIEWIQQYPRDVTRGYFRVNASDVLFKKLKNTQVQRQDQGYVGEVIEQVKGSHTVVHVLAGALTQGQLLELVSPDGTRISWSVETLKDLDSQEVNQVLPGDYGVLPYIKFATHRTAVYSRDGAALLAPLREQIDLADRKLIEALSARFDAVQKLGEVKRRHSLDVLQDARWKEVLKTRSEWALHSGLSPEWVQELLAIIHSHALKIQSLAAPEFAPENAGLRTIDRKKNFEARNEDQPAS